MLKSISVHFKMMVMVAGHVALTVLKKFMTWKRQPLCTLEEHRTGTLALTVNCLALHNPYKHLPSCLQISFSPAVFRERFSTGSEVNAFIDGVYF